MKELYTIDLSLSFSHHGIKGMKWGVRHDKKSGGTGLNKSLLQTAYSVGAKVNPRELKYSLRRLTNNPNATNYLINDSVQHYIKETGTLPNNTKALKAVETMGIQKHKEAKYSNIDDTDIKRLKKYTDAARYSRNINSFLAIGEPKQYASNARELKQTLRKNKLNNLTVYRSCNLQFSTNGIAKKRNAMTEEDFQKAFSQMSKAYNGKKLNENRVFSTSTSPLFAIDTWRKVNPTAANSYNSYMIINCKGCSGLLADGRTSDGKKLVNTRSNQEAILAPDKLQYRKMEYDSDRQMYAITVDAL